MDALGADFTIAMPGVPGQRPHRLQGPPVRRRRAAVSDSGMRNHPLTPMTDANLVRVLQAQLTRRAVGLVAPRRPVARTARRRAIARALRRAARATASRIAIADAIDNDDLRRLGAALRGPAAGHPPARAWRSACRANFGIAAVGRRRRRRCRRSAGFTRDRLGQLLGGDQRAGGSTSCAAGGAALRDRPAGARRRTTTLVGAGAAPGPSALARRRAAGAGLRHRGAAGGRGGAGRSSAPQRAGALVERALAAIARGAGRARRAPAGRRRRRDLGRRACRRSASQRCASARQIDPGVPWCHAAPPRRRPGCTWR